MSGAESALLGSLTASLTGLLALAISRASGSVHVFYDGSVAEGHAALLTGEAVSVRTCGVLSNRSKQEVYGGALSARRGCRSSWAAAG